jgi:hypothetical protein
MKKTLLAAFLVAAVLAGVAFAATQTTTRGRICGHECPTRSLEAYGGYTFEGSTRPSERGQRVEFYFKKAGTNDWRRFGHADPSGTSPAFKSLEDSRNAAINRDHEWSLTFAPYQPGRWVLKALFLRQGANARSNVRIPVTVRSSD